MDKRECYDSKIIIKIEEIITENSKKYNWKVLKSRFNNIKNKTCELILSNRENIFYYHGKEIKESDFLKQEEKEALENLIVNLKF
ncbi:hypothetical protein [Fusobacterium necrophorum]|uniref:hypothetical protein n=1 Tax=Fusobacterium necrophorum TaxID=859 RepID=UPI00254AAC6C|nr:hypothetical protein [Fusobacterium necrophorum]MDK4525211.1 hypothetical protein [Fusobacterium necrophorum]